MSRDGKRYIQVTLTDQQMADLLALAKELGASPARLTEQAVVGAIRDYPRKEG